MDGGLSAVQARDLARRQLSARLSEVAAYEVESKGTRCRLASAFVESSWGEAVEVPVAGRWLPAEWDPDPWRAAERMGTCRSSLHYTGSLQAGRVGGVRAVPHTCGLPYCPPCASGKMGTRCRWAEPRYEALSPWTSRLALVTLTQQWDTGDSESWVVSPGEVAHGWAEPPLPTSWPVPSSLGIPLDVACDRVRACWGRLRRDRRTRGLWTDRHFGAVAYSYGIEATSCTWRDRRRVPRWHVHMHVLVALGLGATWDATLRVVQRRTGRVVSERRYTGPASMDLPTKAPEGCRLVWVHHGGWSKGVVDGWMRLCPGTTAAAQDIRPADDGALAEVLKYPVKVADMTVAQAVEWLGTTKGLRSHYSPGALWPTSVLPADMQEALDAVPDDEKPTSAPLRVRGEDLTPDLLASLPDGPLFATCDDWGPLEWATTTRNELRALTESRG